MIWTPIIWILARELLVANHQAVEEVHDLLVALAEEDVHDRAEVPRDGLVPHAAVGIRRATAAL